VYRGAVSVMMRIIFVLFAEERGLLPRRTSCTSSRTPSQTVCVVWNSRRGKAVRTTGAQFAALEPATRLVSTRFYYGIEHPRLTMHPHDGTLFDPDGFRGCKHYRRPNRTSHARRAVRGELAAARARSGASCSFRELGVEEIGYVYEGLLSYDGLPC